MGAGRSAFYAAACRCNTRPGASNGQSDACRSFVVAYRFRVASVARCHTKPFFFCRAPRIAQLTNAAMLGYELVLAIPLLLLAIYGVYEDGLPRHPSMAKIALAFLVAILIADIGLLINHLSRLP